MRKMCLAVMAFGLTASPAYAMTYFLTGQWFSNGSHFCRYSNGTVLNVGAGICQMSISG